MGAAFNHDSYHCFSAGCLAVSARFLGKGKDEIARTALDVQGRWKEGELTRYEVAGVFVDELLATSETEGETEDKWLEKVNILTTTWYGRPRVTVAKSREELKGLLIKTSFIPFATGFGFNNDGEMDGGFSMILHPRCKRGIYLPVRWDMIANVLNVNMGMETVERLYEEGVKDEEKRKEVGLASV